MVAGKRTALAIISKRVPEAPGSVTRFFGDSGLIRKRGSSMSKLLSALLLSAAFIVPGVALAAQPNRCPGEEFTTVGGFQQTENLEHGTPGNQIGTKKEPVLPANEFAGNRT